jgi:hypothetical protein
MILEKLLLTLLKLVAIFNSTPKVSIFSIDPPKVLKIFNSSTSSIKSTMTDGRLTEQCSCALHVTTVAFLLPKIPPSLLQNTLILLIFFSQNAHIPTGLLICLSHLVRSSLEIDASTEVNASSGKDDDVDVGVLVARSSIPSCEIEPRDQFRHKSERRLRRG